MKFIWVGNEIQYSGWRNNTLFDGIKHGFIGPFMKGDISYTMIMNHAQYMFITDIAQQDRRLYIFYDGKPETYMVSIDGNVAKTNQ
jgi:hypothetical protein